MTTTEMFIEAIKVLGKSPEKLENLKFYLDRHFETWLETYANTPEGITDELKRFAEM